MKLVKFKDGKYGVRKGRFYFRFYDFRSPLLHFWWDLSHSPQYANDCRTDEKTARKFIEHMTDMGEVVK